MESEGLGPKTNVKVVVDGSFTLPLHLAALESLADPILQDEILKEATRLALAERLGGFDGAKITTGHRHGAPVCEVRLNLADLTCAIANTQHAYNHIVEHVQKMQEVMDEAQKRTETSAEEAGIPKETKRCFATLASLAQDALATPCRAPLAEEICIANDIAASSDEFGNDEVSSSLNAGYEPLLDHDDHDVDDDYH